MKNFDVSWIDFMFLYKKNSENIDIKDIKTFPDMDCGRDHNSQ